MTKNMTEGEPARLIFFFALPLVAGNMMQQLYAFIDTLIVGRFLGVNALAAVGCTGSLMFLTLGFLMGFCTGVTIYTGQRFGAGDRRGVRQSAAACILLGVGVALTLTAIVLPLTRTLLVLMETPPEILDGACVLLTPHPPLSHYLKFYSWLYYIKKPSHKQKSHLIGASRV